MQAAILIAVLCAPTPTQTIEQFLAADRNVPEVRAHAVANQIVYCANLTKLDPFVLTMLIDVETGEKWRHTCRGKAGEVGLTQILPSTARACGYSVSRLRKDWGYQILCGAYYLSGQEGDIRHQVARYNGGPRGPKRARCLRYADKIIRKARGMR